MAKKSTWFLPELLTSVFLVLMSSIFILLCNDYMDFVSFKADLFYAIGGGYVLLLFLVLAEGCLVGSYSFKALISKLVPASRTQWCMLGYMGFTLLSALLSAYPDLVWFGAARKEGAVVLCLYGLIFYGVSKFAKPQKWMLYIFGTAVALFSALCILQLFGLNPFGLYPEGLNYFDGYKAYQGAYLGTIGNVDLVASFLCIAIPVLVGCLIFGQGKKRFLLLIPLFAAVAVLLRMWVLAGLVGIFGGTLLCIPVLFRFSKKTRGFYWLGVAVFGVLSLAVIYFFRIGDGLLYEVHQLLHGSVSDQFGSGRIYIWKNVLQRVPQKILFGAGPDTLLMAKIDPFERYDEGLDLLIRSGVDVAHNEYLNILYHQGIFALGEYLIGLGVVLFRWFKKPISKGAAIFGYAVVCYGIQAFFGISQLITAPLFWISLGLLEHYLNEPDEIKFIKNGGKV